MLRFHGLGPWREGIMWRREFIALMGASATWPLRKSPGGCIGSVSYGQLHRKAQGRCFSEEMAANTLQGAARGGQH